MAYEVALELLECARAADIKDAKLKDLVPCPR